MFLLHPPKRPVGRLGQPNAHHLATRQHNLHYTGLVDEITLVIAP
jgi:hypothetical protein